ncbi:hypothetical protein J2T08_000553 [Neorhizobium galegae]|uniref:hypothetical protein n=1 Tax=Neorhizobium galegae TaxID=399 RepID=UPI002780FDE0|nr:hypothetical protein [Neorhizobium galegae]MDQ0132652.1 hypothetical protein [Neorhizobium galegae]
MAFPSKQTTQSVAHRAQTAAALLKKEKKEPSLSPLAKAAVELMVFEGRRRADAAEAVGMKDDSLRKALTKPDVLAFMNECMEVLRTSGRPRALRKMIELVDDAKTERIQFEAAKYLDGMDRPSHAVGATVNVQVNNTVNVTPGYVLDLRPDEAVKSAPQIEHLGTDDVIGLDELTDVPEEE